MADHHGHGHGHGHGAPKVDNFTHPFAGYKPPHVSVIHKRLAVGLGCFAWLWMFYRLKQDGFAWITGVRNRYHDKRLAAYMYLFLIGAPQPSSLL